MDAIHARTRGERMPSRLYPTLMSKTVLPYGKSSPSSLDAFRISRNIAAPDVLAQRLLELQFLRPFHVVADVGDVDAGPGNLQLVQDLDGLQLDDARSAQPRKHDVLRQLAVRSGGRSQRRGRMVAVEYHRKIEPRNAAEESSFRQVEDLAFLAVLEERPPQEQGQRDGNQFRHCPSSPWPRTSAETPRRISPPPPGGGWARGR